MINIIKLLLCISLINLAYIIITGILKTIPGKKKKIYLFFEKILNEDKLLIFSRLILAIHMINSLFNFSSFQNIDKENKIFISYIANIEIESWDKNFLTNRISLKKMWEPIHGKIKLSKKYL